MVTEILQAVANAVIQIGLDIGDLIAIGALIATTVTFVVTHHHSTHSEQTRIARELWEKISGGNYKFHEILKQHIEEINKDNEQLNEEHKQQRLRKIGKPYIFSVRKNLKEIV